MARLTILGETIMFTRGNGVAAPSHAPVPAQPAPVAHGQNDLEAFTIDLAVPLSGHRGAIGHLSFRQPTLGDYVDLGPISRTIASNPGNIEDMRIEVVEDPAAVLRWICRLTGQPEAIIRTMHPRDFAAVRTELSALMSEYQSQSGNAQRSGLANSSTPAG